MPLAVEYGNYARHRTALRVSWPAGHQRTSYFLSLPCRYAIPLLVFLIKMRWIVSQTFIYHHMKAYCVDGVGQVSD